MCNLYRMTKGVDEIARLFAVEPERGANYGEEVYPGYPGLVVADGMARAMIWGFPLVQTGKKGQLLKPKPVTNAREDKLQTPFWRASFQRRRCLVPTTAFAEAEGEKGRMTRTWYSCPGDEPFALAGLWRPTDEWGDAYALVMMDSNAQMIDVHDRMPVILHREDWSRWLHGDPNEVLALCRPWDGELVVNRTAERWTGGTSPDSGNLKLL